jgi:hypothetical protein
VTYKNWYLKIENVHVRFHGFREFTISARHYRVILTPELEKPIPMLGRMTRQESCPVTLEFSGTSLRKLLIEAKQYIDEIGPVEWIIYNDSWAKDKSKLIENENPQTP